MSRPDAALVEGNRCQPVIHVVFDRHPPYAKGRYALTVGKPYRCVLVDDDKALYATHDDAGIAFRIATYGQGYSNGGYWHIEPCNHGEPGGCDAPEN